MKYSVNYNFILHHVILYKMYKIKIISKHVGEITDVFWNMDQFPIAYRWTIEKNEIYQWSY